MIKELTPGQRGPLFELVKYQEKSHREVVFHGSFGWEMNVSSWSKWRESDDEEIIVTVPRETLGIWAENNYVFISTRQVGAGPMGYDATAFVLQQDALNYEGFMRKPHVVRVLITLWDKLIDDIPSLVWGILGGTASALILYWLGVTQ